MKITRLQTTLMFGLAAMCFAQPKLMRFSGSLPPSSARTARGVESVTLAVYGEQSGGAPLWQEVQNAEVDSEGRYSLLMGSTLNEGMPIELFASGAPRWLGVQVNRPGEVEQSRVLLVSVPYALKAADAETLGGKPASAYLLAETPANVSSPAGAQAPTGSANAAPTNAAKPRVSAGSVNFVGKFVDSTNLGNSSIYDFNGAVGIGTTTPTANLELSGNTNPIFRLNGAVPGAGFFFNSQTGTGQDRASMGVNAFFDGNWHLVNTQEPSWLLQLRTAEDDFGILRAAPGASDFANHALFTVKGNGNVGIGTQSPASKLDVAGDVNFSGLLRFQGNTVLRTSVSSAGNIGVGLGALANNNNAVGQQNTAVGANALVNNVQGQNNTAVGAGAMGTNFSGNGNTAIGMGALCCTMGSNNIAIGTFAGPGGGPGGSNDIYIGNGGFSEDNTIRIGNTVLHTAFYAAGIRGITTTHNDAIPVMIDSTGQLGTVSSSRRFKEDIADMGDASRGLMDLRPVTYRYKHPFADGSKPIQYGLIAEEVAEVYPDLVAHSADGQIETVKYQVLDSMLLNEVQRQQAEIRELKLRLARLEALLTNH